MGFLKHVPSILGWSAALLFAGAIFVPQAPEPARATLRLEDGALAAIELSTETAQLRWMRLELPRDEVARFDVTPEALKVRWTLADGTAAIQSGGWDAAAGVRVSRTGRTLRLGEAELEPGKHYTLRIDVERAPKEAAGIDAELVSGVEPRTFSERFLTSEMLMQVAIVLIVCAFAMQRMGRMRPKGSR